LEKVVLVIAVAFGTINVIGGFVVTDRMLGMFKGKPDSARAKSGGESAGADSPADGSSEGPPS
jgi:NAD(P) transhydrogenase subunit alpha